MIIGYSTATMRGAQEALKRSLDDYLFLALAYENDPDDPEACDYFLQKALDCEREIANYEEIIQKGELL